MVEDRDREIMNERIRKALDILVEACDTVAIIATKHNSETDITSLYQASKGNTYALQGSVQDWVTYTFKPEYEDEE